MPNAIKSLKVGQLKTNLKCLSDVGTISTKVTADEIGRIGHLAEFGEQFAATLRASEGGRDRRSCPRFPARGHPGQQGVPVRLTRQSGPGEFLGDLVPSLSG